MRKVDGLLADRLPGLLGNEYELVEVNSRDLKVGDSFLVDRADFAERLKESDDPDLYVRVMTNLEVEGVTYLILGLAVWVEEQPLTIYRKKEAVRESDGS